MPTVAPVASAAPASAWPRRFRRLAILAVFLPFLALAQDQMFTPEQLQPAESDVSVRLLRGVLGTVVDKVRLADALGGADEGAFGDLFRTLNVFDEGVREILAIEVDTSLPAGRVIRVLEQIKESRPLPSQIRVDNGPELISAKLVAWCELHGIRPHHIQPGKPTQNAYIERFNRTFRREVLDAHLFVSLTEVKETVHHWMIAYNEERPHDSLGNLPPTRFREQQTRNTVPTSTFELST